MPYKNIKKRRERQKWYSNKRYANDPEYRARKNERDKKRYANDPEYRERARQRFVRMCLETPWILHWKGAKQRCANPNRKNYKYYGGKGIRMLLTKLEIEILYKRDHADQMEKPSIDRINPRGDYHLGNCRFIELSENCKGARSK